MKYQKPASANVTVRPGRVLTCPVFADDYKYQRQGLGVSHLHQLMTDRFSHHQNICLYINTQTHQLLGSRTETCGPSFRDSRKSHLDSRCPPPPITSPDVFGSQE